MIHTSPIGEETNRALPLAHRNHAQAHQSGGIRMGQRILYLPHAAGRVGKVSARSADRRSLAARAKLLLRASALPEFFYAAGFRLARTFRYTAVLSGARYPSGLRERSAKPPFVGSTPTRASKRERASFVLRKRRSGRIECPDAVGGTRLRCVLWATPGGVAPSH